MIIWPLTEKLSYRVIYCKIRRIGISIEGNEKFLCMSVIYMQKEVIQYLFFKWDEFLTDLQISRLTQFENMGSRPPPPSPPFQITFGR
jgi:hypothetical protein